MGQQTVQNGPEVWFSSAYEFLFQASINLTES